ncbi:TetR/AcrR family transcriptional regulator [Arthrobacter citreus]|nr:TetR/AcrR family transcriptional regulator [Arthrobacter citreus]
MLSENERRAQMVSKINDEVVKNGFKSLTMDGIAKVMGISRGKLYQYFSNKDEVIEAVVSRYITYIENVTDIGNPVENAEFVDEFVSIFFQNIILAGSASEVFLNDLRASYPDLYQNFSNLMNERDAVIRNFYHSGMKIGVFHKGMNAQLLTIQDQTMLSVLVIPKFLYINGLNPGTAIRDYLKLRIVAVIDPAYHNLVNQQKVEEQIKHIDEKFRRVLWNDSI